MHNIGSDWQGVEISRAQQYRIKLVLGVLAAFSQAVHEDLSKFVKEIQHGSSKLRSGSFVARITKVCYASNNRGGLHQCRARRFLVVYGRAPLSGSISCLCHSGYSD